jgi:hypothetical protein
MDKLDGDIYAVMESKPTPLAGRAKTTFTDVPI